MELIMTDKRRIAELEEALTHLLEVQVDDPEGDPGLLKKMRHERDEAVKAAREALRRKQ